MTDADDFITAPQRLRVRQMAAQGAPPSAIRLLATPQIAADEFTRIFSDELACGAAEADRAVAEALLELAKSGKSIQATLAWARQRLGWSGESEVILHDNNADAASGWAGLQALMDEFAAAKAAGSQSTSEMDKDSAAQSVAATG